MLVYVLELDNRQWSRLLQYALTCAFDIDNLLWSVGTEYERAVSCESDFVLLVSTLRP